MRLLPSAEAARRGLEGENKAQRLVVGQTKWPIGEGGCREIGKKAAFLECIPGMQLGGSVSTLRGKSRISGYLNLPWDAMGNSRNSGKLLISRELLGKILFLVKKILFNY